MGLQTNALEGKRERIWTDGEISETVDAGIKPCLSNRLIALDGGKHHHVFAVLILSSSQSGLICSRNFQAQDAISIPVFVGCGLWLVCAIRNMPKDYAKQMKTNKITYRTHDFFVC